MRNALTPYGLFYVCILSALSRGFVFHRMMNGVLTVTERTFEQEVIEAVLLALEG